MDPIADTTAVTGLVDLARNVQTQIDLVKQFSSAECDLRPFKQDIRAFRHTLDELQAVLEGATPNLKQARRPPTPQALRELFLLRASIRSGKSTFLRLDTVLKQLAGDNIVLQYPPGRPPRRLLKVMNVLRRIRDETERLNICCHALQVTSSLNRDLPTMLPADSTRTVTIEHDKKVVTSAQLRYDFKRATGPCEKVHTRMRPPQYNYDNEATFPASQSDSGVPKYYRYRAASEIKQDGQHAIFGLHTSSDEQDKTDSAPIINIKTWLRKVGIHSPLALAIIGSYLIAQYEPLGGQNKHCIFNSDGLTSSHKEHEFYTPLVIDTVATSHPHTPTNMPLPILIAAIATTTFSLTAQHYILTLESRDRDMLILAIVGTGVTAGLVTGLDGIAILLRVTPWCAIGAFCLCGLVLPPIKGRRGTVAGKLRQGELVWTGIEKKGHIGIGGRGWADSGVDIKMDMQDDNTSPV